MLKPSPFVGLFVLLITGEIHAQQPLVARPSEPVIGNVEHFGWGLSGSRGRHYMFGGIAMGDYTDSVGQRRIVAMQHEAHINDQRHLYYRELRTGHRWAFSRQAGADGMYGVWFQLASAAAAADVPPAIGSGTGSQAVPTGSGPQPPRWQPFQRARLEQTGRGEGVSPAAADGARALSVVCCQ
jgi:hypothetical protein